MPPDEAQQIAKVAEVVGDLDKIIDRLFASVAELKLILRQQAGAEPAAGQKEEAGQ